MIIIISSLAALHADLSSVCTALWRDAQEQMVPHVVGLCARVSGTCLAVDDANGCVKELAPDGTLLARWDCLGRPTAVAELDEHCFITIEYIKVRTATFTWHVWFAVQKRSLMGTHEVNTAAAQVPVEATSGNGKLQQISEPVALTTKAGSLTSLNTLERVCSAHMSLKDFHWLSGPGSCGGGGGGDAPSTPKQKSIPTRRLTPARPPPPPEIFLELPNLNDHQVSRCSRL